MNDLLGKKAEEQIKKWLDRPEDGYDFERIPDQMSGLYGSKNISDFTLYKHPYKYWIESKASYENRISFSVLSDIQYTGLMKKSQIPGVFGVVIFLFATHKRAIIMDIRQIDALKSIGKCSINIDKIDIWNFKYAEIQIIPNSRKQLLDYTGNFELNWRLANYGNWDI